jgi:hypothetical protein
MERAMTQISLYGKTANLRSLLLHASLFGAVTAVVFCGMMAVDRTERISTLAYLQCADCSHETGSPDRLQVDPSADGRLQQFLRLLHADEGRGDDMAAILRD